MIRSLDLLKTDKKFGLSLYLCLKVFLLTGCASTLDNQHSLKSPLALITEEMTLEEAIMAGNTQQLTKRVDDGFEFVHGEQWRDGGTPMLVEDKASWLNSVGAKLYLYRHVDTLNAEVWGNTGLTYGYYKSSRKMPDSSLLTFDVWYIRLYEFRDGEWIWLKHLTVDGPNKH